MKTCITCHVEKPFSDYYRKTSSPDGHQTRCKPCQKIKDAAHYQQKKDDYAARKTAWRKANPEKAKKHKRNWKKANPDKYREQKRRWKQRRPDIRAANRAKRRRAVRRACGLLTPELHAQIRAIYAEAQRLTDETGIEHHVDHIIPLQGEFVCGLHVPANLQILPGPENVRKGIKVDLDEARWLQTAAWF
jgi:hypothetical protein